MENKYFSEKKWSKYLEEPDWYLTLYPELKKIKEHAREVEEKEADDIKDSVYSFFERKLESGEIVLGTAGPDWDAEREEIDTVVIHHTSQPAGVTPSRLSAVHLINVYVPYYISPDEKEKDISGEPIYSGHFREDKQIFYSYHWIIRNDGRAERLLRDEEIGWHAGNWEVNKRSVGIVLDGDYTNTAPSEELLHSVASLINEQYGNIEQERMFGHREVRLGEKTECPSNFFLDYNGKQGWKRQLLEML